jgi:hypothetical protein
MEHRDGSMERLGSEERSKSVSTMEDDVNAGAQQALQKVHPLAGKTESFVRTSFHPGGGFGLMFLCMWHGMLVDAHVGINIWRRQRWRSTNWFQNTSPVVFHSVLQCKSISTHGLDLAL